MNAFDTVDHAYMKYNRKADLIPATGCTELIAITVWASADSARVITEDYHTNTTRIERNGRRLFAQEGDCLEGAEGGEGIVKKGMDNTIRIVGRMARESMRDMDWTILNTMMERCRYDLIL